MARSQVISLLAASISLSVCPAQGRHVDPRRTYSMSLPPAWRQMTPGEARDLRSKLPADLKTPLILSRIDRFGNIDSWLAGQLDGRCLTVTREDGEPAMTEETLAEVEKTAAQRSGSSGFRFRLEKPTLVTVGRRKHPAIECIVDLSDRSGKPLARLLELVVPTGGQTLRFSFRSTPGEFAAALPVFRTVAGSLDFTKPPEGRKDLSDKLRMPLIIGGVVGLIFLVIYYQTRKG